jgi:hypothetical protein
MKGLLARQSIIGLLFTSGIRKLLVVLIFSSMVINGFVPKSMEGKNSLFMVMTAVVSNAVTGVFEECRDTLTVISNKITKDLYKLLSIGEVSTDVPVGDNQKKETVPINTSSDNGITVERRSIQQLKVYEIEESIWYRDNISTSKLYRLYENIKVYNGGMEKVGVLFFILFIGVIVRRKDISEEIKNQENKYKTDLC